MVKISLLSFVVAGQTRGIVKVTLRVLYGSKLPTLHLDLFRFNGDANLKVCYVTGRLDRLPCCITLTCFPHLNHILWGWMYAPHPSLVENIKDLAPLSLVVFECHCKLNRLLSQTLLWVLVQVFNTLIVVLLHFAVSWYCGQQVHVVSL